MRLVCFKVDAKSCPDTPSARVRLNKGLLSLAGSDYRAAMTVDLTLTLTLTLAPTTAQP